MRGRANLDTPVYSIRLYTELSREIYLVNAFASYWVHTALSCLQHLPAQPDRCTGWRGGLDLR